VLFSNKDRVGIRVRTTYSVWLVSGYAHVFVLLSVVIVTLPLEIAKLSPLKSELMWLYAVCYAA